MVIFRNIPAAIKLITSLRYLKRYKKNIEDAKLSGDTEKERENILLCMKDWSPRITGALGVDLNVTGRENLPTEGPVVFVSNHQSYADILALCASIDTIPFGFIAKEEIKKIPFYGKWLIRIRSVLMKRGDARASLKAILEGIDLINQGFSLLIFPEGTRSKGGPMIHFKKGALKLATKPKVPIVPITLNGTYRLYEETGVMRGAHVDVIIHPAIETKDLDKQAERELSDRVENIIRSGLLPPAN